MVEREFFVEPTDIANEVREGLRQTQLKLALTLGVWLALTLTTYGSGQLALLVSAVLFVVIVWRFYNAIELAAKKKAALDRGPVEALYRLTRNTIEYIERAKGEDGEVLERTIIILESIVSVQATFRSVNISADKRNSIECLDNLDIPNEKFIDDESRWEFVNLLLPRIKSQAELGEDYDTFNPPD